MGDGSLWKNKDMIALEGLWWSMTHRKWHCGGGGGGGDKEAISHNEAHFNRNHRKRIQLFLHMCLTSRATLVTVLWMKSEFIGFLFFLRHASLTAAAMSNLASSQFCLRVCDALLFCSSVHWGVISCLEIRSFLPTSNLRTQSLQELIPCKLVGVL